MTSTLDEGAVALARALALEVVQDHGHGHAGAPMGLAPAAHVLFQSVLRHDPANPAWEGRDRLVLSAGHASLLLYIQLYLTGYDLGLDDVRDTRMMGSRTPGHPELGETPGVEMSTGPLGQGVASAVGMAASLRHLQGLAGTQQAPFDQQVFCIASDGDLQEGVSAEASSLAGTWGLGNLVMLWDDNGISIDGPTWLSFREDVQARYRSYGWRVESVDGEDLPGLRAALVAARAEQARPTLVAVRSVIGWPAPGFAGTAAAHAGAFGADVLRATKERLGLDPDLSAEPDPVVLTHTRQALTRGVELRASWDAARQEWSGNRSLLDGLQVSPADLPTPLTTPTPTRKANAAVLRALTEGSPALWGGSADLSESTGASTGAEAFSAENPAGGALHFGVREHAMTAILNGIALHGRFRPFGTTYLTFSDYLRPALRMAALMRLPIVLGFTHDSVAVGEDGPTHQPVEQLWSLRMVPELQVIRPADAAETVAVWRRLIERPEGPACLALSRQDLAPLDADPAGAERGGYVVRAVGSPDVLLIATGSEVSLALSAASVLAADGVEAQVVSMPCLEWFEAEPADYREAVLPSSVRARVSVEAGVQGAWSRWTGTFGEAISVEGFGVSGSGEKVLALKGITVDHVVAAARRSIDRAGH